MKIFFYISLLEVSFRVIVIEPKSQIKNSIYYYSLDDDSYHKMVDRNTSFRQNRLEFRQPYTHFFFILERPCDYVIQILHLYENVLKYKNENNNKIENYLLRQPK